MNWTQIEAMERSHRWRVTRGMDTRRSCTACGDTFTSEVRYCPGGTDTAPATAERHIDMPTLEKTDGVI